MTDYSTTTKNAASLELKTFESSHRSSFIVIVLQVTTSAQEAAQLAELVFCKMLKQQGQISANWTQCCKNSGIMLQTNTSALLLSNLTQAKRPGGSVTSVQTGHLHSWAAIISDRSNGLPTVRRAQSL